MVEFNPDGSLKVPAFMTENKKAKELRLKKGNCILIKKEIVSFKPPKKCKLQLQLSEAITNNEFITKVYKYFSEKAETPTKITKINEKEFEVEIGTNFRRCSDCNNLIRKFNEFLDGNTIEEKGNCTYENNFTRKQVFCDEDYFD
jgi:hypothetical protein